MNKAKVLFLCTGNSAHSQMAEGLLRAQAGDRFEAFSAGLEPQTVKPLAGEAMAEIGIDISDHRPKDVAQFLGHEYFGYLITVCDRANANCPNFPGVRPVMKGIEQTFGDQVEVIFYDVWDVPAPANEYGIQMIPTQVFLDESGEEFHRHTGFYPQADIEALLVERGLEKIATP